MAMAAERHVVIGSRYVEGGGSRNYIHTKRLMYADPSAWSAIMQRLAVSVSRYLNAQIEAGCQAVQIFDSWAGCLSPADYRSYVLPWTKAVIDSLPADVPVINFLTGNPALLPLARYALNAYALLRERHLRADWQQYTAIVTRVEMIALGYGFTVRLQADDDGASLTVTDDGRRPGARRSHAVHRRPGVLPVEGRHPHQHVPRVSQGAATRRS